MASSDNRALEIATKWAHSNRDWIKVYRYIFLHPEDLFLVLPGRRYSIAHQIVHHGHVAFFKRILALFSNREIDIHLKTGDNKTCLDIARDKRDAHLPMYTYMEQLFIQDDLIKKAKDDDWRGVMDVLEENKQLANEKPPYSPYFLIHYIVEKGDDQILQDFLHSFQISTNVLNDRNETPLDMAIRLNEFDICSILRPITEAGPSFPHGEPQSPPVPKESRAAQRSTSHMPGIPLDQLPQYVPPSSLPAPSTKPIALKHQLAPIGFENIVLGLSENGSFTIGSPTLVNSAKQPPPSEQRARTRTPPTSTIKVVASEPTLTNLDPHYQPSSKAPSSSSLSKEQLLKNLTCHLTLEVFVDPVIGSDGQTYERTAIIDWLKVYPYSPITGAPMDTTFEDNTEVKQIIQSIRERI